MCCLPSFLAGNNPVFSISCASSLFLGTEDPTASSVWHGVGMERTGLWFTHFSDPGAGILLSSFRFGRNPPRGAEVASAVLWVCGAHLLPTPLRRSMVGLRTSYTPCIQIAPLPEQRIKGWKWSLLPSFPLVTGVSLFCVFMVIIPATKTVTSLSK